MIPVHAHRQRSRDMSLPPGTSWPNFDRLSILVQPAIVSGLLFESVPSLTRASLESNPVSIFVAWLIVICTVLSGVSLLLRFILDRESPMFHIMPEVLQILAACMGISAAISAYGPTPSITLIVGDIVSAGLLYRGSIIVAAEKASARGGRRNA